MIKLQSVFFCSDFKYMWICVCMFVAKHCSSQHPITSVSRFYSARFYLCLTLFFSLFSPFLPLSISIYILLPLLVSKDISVILAMHVLLYRVVFTVTGMTVQNSRGPCFFVLPIMPCLAVCLSTDDRGRFISYGRPMFY